MEKRLSDPGSGEIPIVKPIPGKPSHQPRLWPWFIVTAILLALAFLGGMGVSSSMADTAAKNATKDAQATAAVQVANAQATAGATVTAVSKDLAKAQAAVDAKSTEVADVQSTAQAQATAGAQAYSQLQACQTVIQKTSLITFLHHGNINNAIKLQPGETYVISGQAVTLSFGSTVIKQYQNRMIVVVATKPITFNAQGINASDYIFQKNADLNSYGLSATKDNQNLVLVPSGVPICLFPQAKHTDAGTIIKL